jgi:hypothetical protein
MRWRERYGLSRLVIRCFSLGEMMVVEGALQTDQDI